MRTFYHGPDAIVTDTQFVWQHPEFKVFAIDGLSDVRLVRSAPSGLGRAGVAVGLAVFAAGVAAAVIGGSRPLTFILPSIGLVVAFVAAAARRRRGHGWVIQARYRGREVVVYTTSDSRVFNQVTRALRRAVEQSPGRHSYGLVAS